VKVGIGLPPRVEPWLAGVRQQVLEAPPSIRFKRRYLMPAGLKLAQHAAKKVGVAVVPAASQ
jgi:hypothetical protein